MPMNVFHRRLCASPGWMRTMATRVAGTLDGIELGSDVLEIGPGYGATTSALVDRVPKLTALEIDDALVARLTERFADSARIVGGSGTDMPFPADSFTGVVCFTMLHHIPSPRSQDRLFAEACRVLRPGGVFAGSDSQLSLRFRLLHLGDTMVVVDQATLPDRLAAAGFTEITVHRVAGQLRFSARKP